MLRHSQAIMLICIFLAGTCLARKDAGAQDDYWLPGLLHQAFLFEGLWSDQLRLRTAMHQAGLPYRAAYKSRSPFFRPNDRLIMEYPGAGELPAALPELAGYSVVVLSNLDAVSLGAARLAALEKFVARGGGLVVLGGYWAFSKGGYKGSVLEEMLPVSWPAENRLPHFPAGQLLTPGEKPGWDMNYDFTSAPRVFYLHTFEPKPGSNVDLMAGTAPAMVSGSYGRGRVVACALTANGKAETGQLAYWDWPDWPELLGSAALWTAANRPLKIKRVSAPVRGVKPLSADELNDLLMFQDNLTEEFIARARAFPSAEAAEVFFNFIAGSDLPERAALLPKLSFLLLPHARPAWAEKIKNLLFPSGLPSAISIQTRSAGLVLLGASGNAATAFPVLQQALRNDDLRLAALEGLLRLEDARAVPLLREILHQAETAVGSGSADGIDPEKLAGNDGQAAAVCALALYRLGEPEGMALLVQHFQRIHLYQRIFANAGKRRVYPHDLQGLELRKKIWEFATNLSDRLQFLEEQAVPIPESQLLKLAEVAASPEVTDAGQLFLARLLLRQPGGVPARITGKLAESTDGILRALARGMQ